MKRTLEHDDRKETRELLMGRTVEKVRELHSPVEIEPSETICAECSYQLPNGRYFGKIVEYPCPTVEAIDGDSL